MRIAIAIMIVAAICLSCMQCGAGPKSGHVIGWGYAVVGDPNSQFATCLVTSTGQALRNAVAIAGEYKYGIALKDDGTVTWWGYSEKTMNVADTLSNVVAIAAGSRHVLALKKDGMLSVWGDAQFEKTVVPAGLGNVIAIAAGWEESLAVRNDGVVIGWGLAKVPIDLRSVVAIAASPSWNGANLALQDDGTVVEWNKRTGSPITRHGLSNVVAISSGAVHRLALRADGTVAAWGSNANGETTVPTGLSNVVAIAAGGCVSPGMRGYGFSLALREDGTIVAWGKIGAQSAFVPAGLSNVVAITAGGTSCLAITTNPAVAARFRR